MDLGSRVRAAFDADLLLNYGQSYLDALLAIWRELVHSLRKTLLLLAALMLAFLLLQGAKNAQFALGPLRLTNVAAVLTLIPILVSALIYEFVILMVAQKRYRDTITETVRLLHPSLYEYGLDHMLYAASNHFVVATAGRWEQMRTTRPGLANKVLELTGLASLSCLTFGAFGFLIYAYSHLFADSHANAIAVSVSAAIALVFFIQTAALLVDSND
jgi:hypothetical protein